jgi:glucose-1-phosphate thymidylyltransferase
MIGIVLAGGYAKTLWPLTIDRAKPLLPVAGKAIIDCSLDAINSLDSVITRITVLTNARFQPQFEAWALGKKLQKITIICDGSSNEEEKPGAIGALATINGSSAFLSRAGTLERRKKLRRDGVL